MSTIPAKAIVSVNSNVLSPGGEALDLSGLVITQNTRVPIGSVLSFPSAAAVAAYFGAGSAEALGAPIYFNGFENSDVKPAALLFAQYAANAVGAYLRGGSLASMTLTQLKALTGVLTLTVNGVQTTSATITLASATSFSNAATLIQAAFASPSFTVTFDSVSSAFLFAVNTTGPTSTITFATGTLSASVALTAATGAVTSQGTAANDPVTMMNSVINQTTNWASFMTIFDPDNGSGNANKMLFAGWTAQQLNRYMYVCWDNDVAPSLAAPATGSMGYLLNQSNSSGIALVWGPSATPGLSLNIAWFVCGLVASIDYNQPQGNTDASFKSQSGLVATVTDETAAANLLANGYNFYGAYATANDQFIWLYNGQISGSYKTIRAYVNQIWISNQLQLAGMVMFGNVKAVPYNVSGYTQLEAACLDPINQAVSFGAIQAGVTLSNSQKAAVNAEAGRKIDNTLYDVGWYLQVLDASPQVRNVGGSPPMNFWYTDGGSIRRLNINSTDIQ